MLNLVSDSSCDLISGELNSPYARLTVAPMCLHVGGQDYLDTPELDIPALLSKLAHHRSSSACPSPAASGRHPAPDAGHPHCRGSHGRGYDPRGQKGPWRGPHR